MGALRFAGSPFFWFYYNFVTFLKPTRRMLTKRGVGRTEVRPTCLYLPSFLCAAWERGGTGTGCFHNLTK